MEKQYKIEMYITLLEGDEIPDENTVGDIVLDALEEAPFQVDAVIAKEERNFYDER
jgi:hypothetical protein